MSMIRYPPDPQAPFILESGPSDSDLVVKEGSLLYHPRRDGRFPYLYRVKSHPQVEEMTCGSGPLRCMAVTSLNLLQKLLLLYTIQTDYTTFTHLLTQLEIKISLLFTTKSCLLLYI